MNKQNKIKDDYDSPWKEGLELYFKEFMEFFFLKIAFEIDWDRGYEFLDKELQSIVGRSRYASENISNFHFTLMRTAFQPRKTVAKNYSHSIGKQTRVHNENC